MLSIESILKYIHQNLSTERFTIIDDEHILDTKTGVEWHLYDTWLKATRNNDTIIMASDLSNLERQVVWEIKKVLIGPQDLATRDAQYKEKVKQRRAHLSQLYENPEPLLDKTVTPEKGTTEYTG